MANISLLLCSSLVMFLALFYFKRRWPDLDLIDIYIIYIALHFGVYPFIRSLYVGKGVVYDSATSDPLVIGLVFLHLLLIVIIIRMVSAYLPTKIKDIFKLETLINKWVSVNNVIVISIYSLLILFQIISYWKYGVRSHIPPDEFAKIGSDLPYWLMSLRTIFNFIVFSVFIVLSSKVSMSQYHAQYFWIALIIIFIPVGAYFGRKPFVNIFVMGAIIWLIRREKKLFQFKYLILVALMLFSFVLVSNVWQTYRYDLQVVGVSHKEAKNPIFAALNFNATLRNLKERPGTWEFNYLVFERQTKSSEKASTNGEITREGLKSVIPRLFWPDKKFNVTAEILANLYGLTLKDLDPGPNIFGVAQVEFGYLSIIIVAVSILVVIIITATLMKMTVNQPIFFWLFSANFLYFLVNVEENQNDLFIMLRNMIIIIFLFLLYTMLNNIIARLRKNKYAT